MVLLTGLSEDDHVEGERLESGQILDDPTQTRVVVRIRPLSTEEVIFHFTSSSSIASCCDQVNRGETPCVRSAGDGCGVEVSAWIVGVR